jgi:hypothetical protein
LHQWQFFQGKQSRNQVSSKHEGRHGFWEERAEMGINKAVVSDVLVCPLPSWNSFKSFKSPFYLSIRKKEEKERGSSTCFFPSLHQLMPR